MDFHPEDVIISLINITVLFILLRLILWKHVIRFLSDRAKRVSSEKDEAEKIRLDAEALRSEYDKKIEGLEERGRDMLRESQQKAIEESNKILDETRNRAKEMMDDAEARIAEEKEQALADAQHDVAELATEMAARILAREVSSVDNTNAVDEFFRD